MKKKYFIFTIVFISVIGFLSFIKNQNYPVIESVIVKKYDIEKVKDNETIVGYNVELKEEFPILEEELESVRKYLSKINWERKGNIVDMAYHQEVTLIVQYKNGETQDFDIWSQHHTLEIKSNSRYGKLKGRHGSELKKIIY